jgi:hypothetical protein
MAGFTIDAKYHKDSGKDLSPVEDGLYGVEVVKAEAQEYNGKTKIAWAFRIVVAEPDKEDFLGRQLFHYTNCYTDPENPDPKKQDMTWPTVNVVRALGTPVRSGQLNSVPDQTGKRCGVRVVTEPHYNSGEPVANIKQFLTLSKFGEELAKIRNESEYRDSLTDDVSSDDLD